jgi:hypothetical protein
LAANRRIRPCHRSLRWNQQRSVLDTFALKQFV